MRRKKVLLIDDPSEHAEQLRANLVHHHYAVELAAGGAAGFEAASHWLPDAVLMNVSGENSGGYQALSRLRHGGQTPTVPIIATSINDGPEEVLNALLAGANHFVRWPYNPSEVVSELDALLRKHHQQRQITALATSARHITRTIDVDRLLKALLRALQHDLACDLLMLCWAKGPDRGQLAVIDAADVPDALLADLQWRVHFDQTHEGDDQPDLTVLFTGEGHGPSELGSLAMLPLVLPYEGQGIVALGSFSRDADDASAAAACDRLAPLLGELLSAPIVPGQVDPELAAQAQEPELLLAVEGEHAAAWAEALEESVHGTRVTPLGSLDALAQLPGGGTHAHVLLVDRALARDFAAGAGDPQTLPVRVALDAARLDGGPQALGAFVIASVLYGIRHGKRTGCLHLHRQGADALGMLVFQDGQLAWATSAAKSASFLSLLSNTARVSRQILHNAVKQSALQGKSFYEVLLAGGVVSEEVYRLALRTFLSMVASPLLAEPRLQLFWSTQVNPSSTQVAVDPLEVILDETLPSRVDAEVVVERLAQKLGALAAERASTAHQPGLVPIETLRCFSPTTVFRCEFDDEDDDNEANADEELAAQREEDEDRAIESSDEPTLDGAPAGDPAASGSGDSGPTVVSQLPLAVLEALREETPASSDDEPPSQEAKSSEADTARRVAARPKAKPTPTADNPFVKSTRRARRRTGGVFKVEVDTGGRATEGIWGPRRADAKAEPERRRRVPLAARVAAPVDEPVATGWFAGTSRKRRASEANRAAIDEPSSVEPKATLSAEAIAAARHFEIGMTMMRQGQLSYALDEWHTASKLDPENERYQFNIRHLERRIQDAATDATDD